MTTLTIEIPDNVEQSLSDLIIKLGGKVTSGKLAHSKNSTKKKKEILADLEQAVNFTKLHKDGKIEAKSLSHLLNEL